MDKSLLQALIVERLTQDLDVIQRAAQTAYETATHEENIAENKYDTLGLEASYLATGQARRLEEIRQGLQQFQKLPAWLPGAEHTIAMGALVLLEDEHENHQWLFLGPSAAGLKVHLAGHAITVITPMSPLGHALMGKALDDEIDINVAGVRQHFFISDVL
ncbi:GreA/GreB family elongation factor [Pseudomonas sp. dw_358]|uniref:GreA/GreB family elongation factor n=1 Tax=Pseudomonas sp. dw_358 TaxID=2720083 RepID=UPI001BD4E7D1